MKLTPVALCLAVAVSSSAGSLWAQPAIALQSIASGLPNITAITHAGDGSGRLFITLQDGRVRVHDGCVLLGTPFLDIRTLVLAGGERGLLSVAFHPNYPATPYFYVYYTRQTDGAIVIARYRVSAGNPNVADPATAAVLLVIPHPSFGNHNGGQLQFGPDGYLYIGTGDGGSANDPNCNAQDDDTLLGRILRIDVDQNFNTPPFYGIPPSNPGTVGLPETWAKGMRNPWRLGFDRSTGDLLIGDVGQGSREEVDFEPAGAAGGRNYGWKVMEGTICTGTSTAACDTTPPMCFSPAYTAPAFDYGHSAGRCSITGGYRYRGSQIAGLAGYYVYGDYCTGEIFAASESGGVWTSGTSSPLLDNAFNITTFGEDEAGELYVGQGAASGSVFRIVGAGPTANLSIAKTDGQTTAVPGQPLTYTIAVGNAGPYTSANATVLDAFPASLQSVSWSCSATTGSSCCSVTGGGGNINNRPIFVLPGGTVTFTATGTLSAAATGTLTNTATVTAPAGVPDPATGNNTATDVDTILTPTDLAITKTDGETTAAPGQVRTYTIAAVNNGPSPATGATVADNVPASLTGATWTCVGAGGGTCAAGGSGNINDTVSLPVGATVTYTLTGTVGPNPTGLANTATVTVPSGMVDSNPANDSATDDDILICVPQVFLLPDGRVTASAIGASATEWFALKVRIGHSYSLEFKNVTGSGPPGSLTVFSGDDGCSGTPTAVVRDTAAIDPGTGTGAARVSFTAAGSGTFFRARLQNTTGSPIGYTFSLSETTMFGPAWSTNGPFDTYYSFQNTTGATLNATLTLRDTAGTLLATFSTPIPPGRTATTNTSSLGVTRNRTGTARFTHDGPPGAVNAEAAVANFSTNPAYVQPVKLEAVRQAVH